MKMLGQPLGCAKCRLATVSTCRALVGAEQSVLVDGAVNATCVIFDVDGGQER